LPTEILVLVAEALAAQAVNFDTKPEDEVEATATIRSLGRTCHVMNRLVERSQWASIRLINAGQAYHVAYGLFANPRRALYILKITYSPGKPISCHVANKLQVQWIQFVAEKAPSAVLVGGYKVGPFPYILLRCQNLVCLSLGSDFLRSVCLKDLGSSGIWDLTRTSGPQYRLERLHMHLPAATALRSTSMKWLWDLFYPEHIRHEGCLVHFSEDESSANSHTSIRNIGSAITEHLTHVKVQSLVPADSMPLHRMRNIARNYVPLPETLPNVVDLQLACGLPQTWAAKNRPPIWDMSCWTPHIDETRWQRLEALHLISEGGIRLKWPAAILSNPALRSLQRLTVNHCVDAPKRPAEFELWFLLNTCFDTKTGVVIPQGIREVRLNDFSFTVRPNGKYLSVKQKTG
jgi:hypothetical protein